MGFTKWRKAAAGYSVKNQYMTNEDSQKSKGFSKHQQAEQHTEVVEDMEMCIQVT